jgi:hypothetical protein
MDVGRVALRRGPLIYCCEEVDNPGAPVQTLVLPRAAAIAVQRRGDLFGGVMTLAAAARRLVSSDASGALYSREPPKAEDAVLTAVPYYLWNNRAPGSMEVWIAESD